LRVFYEPNKIIEKARVPCMLMLSLKQDRIGFL